MTIETTDVRILRIWKTRQVIDTDWNHSINLNMSGKLSLFVDLLQSSSLMQCFLDDLRENKVFNVGTTGCQSCSSPVSPTHSPSRRFWMKMLTLWGSIVDGCSFTCIYQRPWLGVSLETINRHWIFKNIGNVSIMRMPDRINFLFRDCHEALRTRCWMLSFSCHSKD